MCEAEDILDEKIIMFIASLQFIWIVLTVTRIVALKYILNSKIIKTLG